jgi:type III secretion protein N (ATPase)
MREVLATYERQKDLILIGAYQKGTDRRVDYAIAMVERINGFLKQPTTEKNTLQETVKHLRELFR